MNNFFLAKDGTRYYEGRPFTYGEINYTSAGATAETFEALGFKAVQSQPRPDDRYYIINSYPKDDGSWDATPRDLDQLKAGAIQQCKQTAGTLLAATDWLVIRQQETGEVVPAAVLTHRAAVRQASNDYELAVQGVAAIDELAELVAIWPDTQLNTINDISIP